MQVLIDRAQPDPTKFNQGAVLPYQLRLQDFDLALRDLFDLLFDMNTALVARGLQRLEETVRPAIFSGIVSEALAASVARHSRVLTVNRFHNGHPDLIPRGRFANDAVQAGEEGVEIKATKGQGGAPWTLTGLGRLGSACSGTWPTPLPNRSSSAHQPGSLQSCWRG